MNSIKVEYYDGVDNMEFSTTFESPHIAEHVNAMRRALLAMSFSESLVDKYIPWVEDDYEGY